MKKNSIETPYASGSIEHFTTLDILLDLVKQVLGYRAEHKRVSPVYYAFTKNNDPQYQEIILNQSFTLNPHLVHFSLKERPGNLEDFEKDFTNFNFLNDYYDCERHENRFFDGKNFEDGTRNLLENLQKNLIVIRNAPTIGKGGVFADSTSSLFLWSLHEKKFFKIASLNLENKEMIFSNEWTVFKQRCLDENY